MLIDIYFKKLCNKCDCLNDKELFRLNEEGIEVSCVKNKVDERKSETTSHDDTTFQKSKICYLLQHWINDTR